LTSGTSLAQLEHLSTVDPRYTRFLGTNRAREAVDDHIEGTPESADWKATPLAG
jgi:hypothetical protein